VRWQSLVEPQTYEAYIVIPELIQQAMVKPEKAFVPPMPNGSPVTAKA
jgi:hypothetical protein